MLRKLVLVVSFACLVFVAAMIVSCGSSKNHLGTMCTGGPFNVVGDWQGTIGTGTSSQGATGVINTQGQALFFDSDSRSSGDPASGSVAALPAITGACAFSGAVTIYNVQSIVGTVSGTVQGNVNSATSISGNVTVGSGSTAVSFSSYAPLSGSVTALTSTMDGQIPGNTQPVILVLTLQPHGTGASMTFASTAQSSCAVNGTLTQEGTSNVFDASMTFGSGSACPSPSSSSGLAFESNTDLFGYTGSPAATGTYLYVVSSNSAFVLEIYPQLAVAQLNAHPSSHSFAAKPRAFILR